jgi:hypothetical protein
MNIRKKHQDLAAKYHWLITPVGALLAGYLGVGEYEKYEQRKAEAAGVGDVTITVEAPVKGPTHSHGAVVSQNDINTLIKRAVDRAVAEQHEKDLLLFKTRETWD